MLGGKPRHQALGPIIGIWRAWGLRPAVPAVPAAGRQRRARPRPSSSSSRCPAAAVKGVAEIISNGLKGPADLGRSRWRRGRGSRHRHRRRCASSPRAASRCRPCPSAWRGAAARIGDRDAGRRADLLAHVREAQPTSHAGYEIWVEGAEPICAGLISGAALMGIGNAIVGVLIG